MLPSLFLVPFFGEHEFGQRFAAWITPCASSCLFTVSSLGLYPDAQPNSHKDLVPFLKLQYL